MKRINPQNVLQHPISKVIPSGESLFISIYANSLFELNDTIEQAREMALQDFEKGKVARLFRPFKDFLKSDEFIKAEFPLAMFSTKGFSGFIPLPFATKPLAVVARSFHVKPLLKWIQREQRYSLLRLFPREALLYRGSLAGIHQSEIIPFAGLSGGEGIMLNLDRVVCRSLDEMGTPLILAGDAKTVEIFRHLSRYKNIVEEAVIDSEWIENDEILHRAAVEILEPYLERRESALLGRYWSAERTGHAVSVLSEIIKFAIRGDIKHLFVNEKMNLWGEIDSTTGQFTYSPRQSSTTDDDILDDLAELVIRMKGAVTILPSEKMPYGYAACAVIRTRDKFSAEFVKPYRRIYSVNPMAV